MVDKQHIITITPALTTSSPPINITITPPSPKLYITAPPPIQTIASNNVIDIEQQQQQQQKQANTSNVPVYCRSCARFCITIFIMVGLLTSLWLYEHLIVLAKQKSRDSSAFISHLEKSVGYNISAIGMITAIASGFLLLAFLGLPNIDLKYSLHFKFFLVAFSFGIIFGPSMLFLQIFATHLAYRVCGGVILAAYFGGLSYCIGRW